MKHHISVSGASHIAAMDNIEIYIYIHFKVFFSLFQDLFSLLDTARYTRKKRK